MTQSGTGDWKKHMLFRCHVNYGLYLPHICVHCAPTSPKELWETQKDVMMEDYIHRHGISALAAQQWALQAIDAILQESGMLCSGLVLPDIDGTKHRGGCI